MAGFWDGVKLAGVLIVGVIFMVGGMIVFAVVDTVSMMIRIVRGKR